MNLGSAVAKGFTSLSLKFPQNRKVSKLYKHVNWLFLTLGANPIVIAKMKDRTQIKVDLSTRTERLAFYTGIYDADLLAMVIKLLSKDSVFIDVGANIGFYSVAVSNHFKTTNKKGKVISFEPFEGNFKRLKFNINHNQLEGYCNINNYGLSDMEGTNEITLREDFKHGSSTGNAAIPTSEILDKGFKKSTIKLKTLDDTWSEQFHDLKNIDVIKIDIEGHEDFCLRGGKKTISLQRPTILMEVNKPYYQSRGVRLDETFLPLIPENYKIFRKKQNHWEAISSLEECHNLDNVFLVPEEKLQSKAYDDFN